MIVHLDSDNPKSIEKKVQELILKKLFIKVDDEKIFINKEVYISLILRDIIVIAKAEFDIDEALAIALHEQKEYQTIPDTKRTELEETSMEFQVEIEAYQFYLDVVDDIGNDEIYNEIQLILNSETEFLQKKLHELIMDSLGKKLSEVDTTLLGSDRWSLLDTFANQVKLIASNDTIDEAVEEAYLEFDDYPNKQLVKKASIKREFERFAPLAKEEIDCYKIALAMENQNAEFPMILGMVKQLLQLED